MSMAGRLSSRPPTSATSTTMAGRGRRTGKNISKRDGKSRRKISFPQTYSTFSSELKGEHHAQPTESLDHGRTHRTSVLDSIRHTRFITSLVRHVRSD